MYLLLQSTLLSDGIESCSALDGATESLTPPASPLLSVWTVSVVLSKHLRPTPWKCSLSSQHFHQKAYREEQGGGWLERWLSHYEPLVSLPEDLSSDPCTHLRQLTTAWNLVPGDPAPSSVGTYTRVCHPSGPHIHIRTNERKPLKLQGPHASTVKSNPAYSLHGHLPSPNCPTSQCGHCSGCCGSSSFPSH